MRKDNTGIRWNPTTPSPTPYKNYSLLRIIKEDPVLNYPMMTQTNVMLLYDSLSDECNAFIHASTKTTQSLARGPPLFQRIGWSRTDVSKTLIGSTIVIGPQGQKLFKCASSGHEQTSSLASSQTVSTSTLSQSIIPTCFKLTTIIPVPKNSKAMCHNDYCSVPVISVIMSSWSPLKCWSWHTSTPSSQTSWTHSN